MRHILTFSLILTYFNLCQAQDERFFREIYTDKLKNRNLNIDTRKRKVIVRSPLYQLDINDDGLTESLISEKQDNEDYFVIENFRGQVIFRERLYATGAKASLYKIGWSRIHKKSKVLILHFFEGYTRSTKFEGIARLYFVTIDNNDIDSLKMTKGPYMWHEFEKPRETFWRRAFKVNVLDYNKDGVREVSVNFNKINSLYFYKGGGEWGSL